MTQNDKFARLPGDTLQPTKLDVSKTYTLDTGLIFTNGTRYSKAERTFIYSYIETLNSVAAARAASGKPHMSQASAQKYAHRMTKKPHVSQAIEAGLQQADNLVLVNKRYVIDKLKENVERCLQVEPVRDKDGQPTGEYQYNASAANKALELLGRHLRVFDDQDSKADAATVLAAIIGGLPNTFGIEDRRPAVTITQPQPLDSEEKPAD